MKISACRFGRGLLAASIAALAAAPMPATAGGKDIEALRQTVEQLRKQLQEVQQQLKEQEQKAASKEEVQQVREEVAQAAEWKDPNTLIHMAGYADVGYTSTKGGDDSFNAATFAPIFHFQYRDLVMLEAELEAGVQPDGETEIGLEYLTVDFFVNDYLVLVGGKFLSPIGQFRQNLHPSWINKLPSAPPGFGHDGAAPTSDVGLQLRGGYPLGAVRTNYAVYVSNGPELNAVEEDGEIELEGIAAEGFGADRDGEKVFGGRLGVLPIPSLELGLSGATGKATVTSLDTDGPMPDLSNEQARDYDVIGADFNWHWRDLILRGEFVRSKIGAASTGATASGGGTWQTWYTQASYQFKPTKWEAAIRYTDFDSPHASEDQKQWALGANYLFASNIVAKIAYEFNDGQADTDADADRLLLQMAYGF